MADAERQFLDRIRKHYGREGTEILKAIRLPLQAYSQQSEWDVDLLKVVQELRS